MKSTEARAWIGTSGWEYEHWKELYYPKSLKGSEHLSFYASEFDTAEVNNSFYRLPAFETYEKWAGEVPENFRFSLKASRYLTHMKKLKEPEDPWQRILDSSAGLGKQRGPILLQFPGNWKKNIERLSQFLEMVFANNTDTKLAFELRHESWYDREVVKTLEKFGCALCIVDAPNMVRKEFVTADFLYIRYHGRSALYASKYTKRQLEKEAKKISEWLGQKISVYAYFNNDGSAHAIQNARTLKSLLQ